MSLPEGYGYIPSSLITIGWVLVWQGYMVGGYRKKAGLEYSQLYAEKAGVKDSTAALRLNCMQRAHQTTLEQAPVIFVSYKSGKPKRRMYGSVASHLSILVCLAKDDQIPARSSVPFPEELIDPWPSP
ncbi:hypothetical protein CY34DRAFT_104017 [Suillus luteus UH-Slu-Lm8-n1]|uniref:Uncharacterized protein n=1 Tax=Suillus luteus UH-Slu-Lm8-n1 TaxID=930992 RepID=A0A0D0B307_9AGAM|nr:hypothetical protein CY34DRAFT_104017 [Suillus luteus UH-Slu-Lm8-n1]